VWGRVESTFHSTEDPKFVFSELVAKPQQRLMTQARMYFAVQ
jgi:hypothetical protein